MAGGFTAAFLDNVLSHIQQATGSPTVLATTDLWLHLYHTSMNDTISGTDTGRLSTAAKVNIVNTTGTWTLSSNTSPASFNNKIVISVTTDSSFSGTGQSFAITTTSSTNAGTILFFGDITPLQVISTGNTVQFATGALVFSLGGGTAT